MDRLVDIGSLDDADLAFIKSCVEDKDPNSEVSVELDSGGLVFTRQYDYNHHNNCYDSLATLRVLMDPFIVRALSDMIKIRSEHAVSSRLQSIQNLLKPY